MSKYGLIYIVSNSEQKKNLFKIGKTSRTIEERIKELNSATGTLGKFKPHATFLVEDIDNIEKKLHSKLSDLRYQKNREFFESNYTELLLKVENIIKNDSLKKIILSKPDPKIIEKMKKNKTKVEKEFFNFDLEVERTLEEKIKERLSENQNTKKIINENNKLIKEFSKYQFKIFKENVKKLKKGLKKNKFIKFYEKEEEFSYVVNIRVVPNNYQHIEQSNSAHNENLEKPYKYDMGFIKLYFRKEQGWACCETLRKHYSLKDHLETDDKGDYIYNLNKFFKCLVDDFAEMLASHKEDETEFYDKLNEYEDKYYRNYYNSNKYFRNYKEPYNSDENHIEPDELVEGYRFTLNDCDDDFAIKLYKKLIK